MVETVTSEFQGNLPVSGENSTNFSPRSLKALQSLGINQEDFSYRSPSDFVRQWGEKNAERAATHFNQRADQLLDEARTKRRELMGERERRHDGSTVQRSSLADETSSLIEREKRKMEQMKKKQQQEVEQLMEHELKMQEIRARNDEKMMLQMKRLEDHRHEVEEQRRKQEEQKRTMEIVHLVRQMLKSVS